ncbi:hypothetical protein C1646_275210 [Rhizophagus diaphanus]|nr:hypothetical protein C1646_275210 [Rhizophagus diaphanus] [Rhizophagus sp. MUCL 43196]
MGEKVNRRVYRTLQESSSLSSVWRPGEVGRTTLLSADSDNNYMGRSSPPLDESRNENENEVIQRNEASRPERISFPNANFLGKQNYDDGTECAGSPINSKYNCINERRKDCEIYVRDISPQRNSDRNNNERNAVQEQRINSNIESGKYSDSTMVLLECCPNKGGIERLQLSLGKLCRVGTFTGNARTEEKPKTSCHFVVPDVPDKKKRFLKPCPMCRWGKKRMKLKKIARFRKIRPKFRKIRS